VTTHKWYARPVFHVADINRAANFYVEKLGFVKKWHEADGAGTVCQVDRGECEIILTQEERDGKSRLFVELTPEGLAELRRELAARAVPFSETRWGYDCLRVLDPDGNELLFPFE
jgi:catechol 2,3-dioxygenase-like lactoylglutathione lyase family enzyme